jgi:hypothetical protein
MKSFVQRTTALALAAFLATAVSAGAATDPCSLLTKADAVRVLGGAVTGGHRGNECSYRLSGTGKNVYASADGTSAAVAYFNEVKKTGKPVSGLGAPAYFVAGSLSILKGGTLLQVGLITDTGDVKTMNPELPALAKLVLSRL